MPRLIELELGDRLVLTDGQTGALGVIYVEGPRNKAVRLKLDLHNAVQVEHIKLDARIDEREKAESEPDHAANIAEAHAAVDYADDLLSEPASIRNAVIHGNTAHPFVDPHGGVR